MKGIILYTSKTGVTEDIAKQIQKESTFDLDLVKLKKKMDTVDFQNYDFIIIGTPTYVSRSPKIMRVFYSQTLLRYQVDRSLYLQLAGNQMLT